MSVWALLIVASSVLAAASPSCEPVEGVEPLLAPGRVLVLGELHGTEQSPAFTGDVACHAAAAGLEVVVGLELPSSIKKDVEAFLGAPRTPRSREALLSSSIWKRGYQDGRTSRAMVDLLGRIAEIRDGGHKARVELFDASSERGGQIRDRAMAANLIRSAERSPTAMHIVLTGDAHSRISRGGRQGAEFEPMTHLLARRLDRERVIALNAAHAGGTAWICGPDCGEVRVRGRGPELRWKIEIDEATRPAGHHGWYGVGAILASPPAASGATAPARLDVSPVAPPPAPEDPFPEQTAELLSPFQGSWQAYQYGSKAWTIDIEHERFRGVLGPDDWYEGRIRLRPDSKPAAIDFVIEHCRCDYRGMTSQAIFRLAGESIVLAAPTPGSPRPKVFNPNDGRMVELKRAR